MLNNCTFLGRMTKDPELRYTAQQTPVASFTIACEDDYAANGERKAQFIDCVAWKNTAEFVSKYFGKGSLVVVNGRLQFRDWKDKNGVNHRNAEILVSNVYFGDSKKQELTQFEDLSEDEGELPFA